MNTNLSPELIARLITLAKRTTNFEDEDFNPFDASGGNYDDAHHMGMNDGEIYLARDILDALGIDY